MHWLEGCRMASPDAAAAAACSSPQRTAKLELQYLGAVQLIVAHGHVLVERAAALAVRAHRAGRRLLPAPRQPLRQARLVACCCSGGSCWPEPPKAAVLGLVWVHRRCGPAAHRAAPQAAGTSQGQHALGRLSLALGSVLQSIQAQERRRNGERRALDCARISHPQHAQHCPGRAQTQKDTIFAFGPLPWGQPAFPSPLRPLAAASSGEVCPACAVCCVVWRWPRLPVPTPCLSILPWLPPSPCCSVVGLLWWRGACGRAPPTQPSEQPGTWPAEAVGTAGGRRRRRSRGLRALVLGSSLPIYYSQRCRPTHIAAAAAQPSPARPASRHSSPKAECSSKQGVKRRGKGLPLGPLFQGRGYNKSCSSRVRAQQNR